MQVKRILYEDEDGSSDSSRPGSASSEDEDIFEETAQVVQRNTNASISHDNVSLINLHCQAQRLETALYCLDRFMIV